MQYSLEHVQINIKEEVNAIPGKRVRAVGMCFYGAGQDLVRGKTYKLERNPCNFRDSKCIEMKQGD